MVIHAHLQESEANGGRNREPRRTLRLETVGLTALGDAAHVRVHNISAAGMLIETQVALRAGEALAVDLPQAGAALAVVVWQSGQLFGCQFDQPITPAVLSAAQLRGAVEHNVELATSRHVSSDEGLGMRLQRLRRELGMSQAGLAAKLGVSKPTVWAWEHGRARPVGNRIAPLAAALGVSAEDLLAGQGNPILNDVLANCREQIAKAVGVGPDKVRIVIEL